MKYLQNQGLRDTLLIVKALLIDIVPILLSTYTSLGKGNVSGHIYLSQYYQT